MSSVTRPHFALPLRLDPSGRLAVLQQDTPEEITQCAAVVAATRQGTRVEDPSFGAPAQDWSPDPAAVAAAITEHEPRAVTTASDVTWTPGASLAQITVEVRRRV